MNRSKPILFAGIGVGCLGIGYFATSAYRSFTKAKPSPVTTFVDEAGSNRLETAEQFLSPVTEQDRVDIPARLAEAMRAEFPDPRDDALRAIFRERLEIALNPEYDHYVAHVSALTGKAASEVRAELGEAYRSRWTQSTQTLSGASYALDGCEIFPGDRDLIPNGGAIASRTDPGVYGSAALLAQENAELRSVRVPVMFSVSMNGVGQTYLLHFVTAFVWNETRSVWIPFAAGYHDPTGTESRLPAPWI